MNPGTIIRLPDGREGTVVYHGLDGYGIMWGRIDVDVARILAAGRECHPRHETEEGMIHVLLLLVVLAAPAWADPPCDPPGLRGKVQFAPGMSEDAKANERAKIVARLSELAATAMPPPGTANPYEYRAQKRAEYADALGGADAMRACEERGRGKGRRP